MSYLDSYNIWLEKVKDQADLYDELVSIQGIDKEIEDRFYKELSFGTGGLRGVIGAGTNRMNLFTVGRATKGLASYIVSSGGSSAVIAYDSRNKSREFAFIAADILSSFGIKVYIFNELTPTPVLSYAVRHYGAFAGIVITASHNPKEYNGYKVYNSNGCQITDSAAATITAAISNAGYFDGYTKDPSLITVIHDEIFELFLSDIKKLSINAPKDSCIPKIVYTPLHGTGRRYVSEILKRIGIDGLVLVKEQELEDGEFTTCPYPNPEEREALSLAIEYAERIGADMVLATDPDADRVGVAVKEKDGKYKLLNGNETGLLLTNYILSEKSIALSLAADPTVIKTIVSTDMAFSVAKKYGASVREVLTGFKYIGELMDELDNFVIGFEESYGYLIGAHARDKDAVSASMMIAEMCAYYKSIGKSLSEVLAELYEEHGYYKTALVSVSYPGKAGMDEMNALINSIRSAPPAIIFERAVEFTDYKYGDTGLPKSDVMRFKNDVFSVIIRPSGTEPKLKIYFSIKAENENEAESQISALISEVKGGILKN